MIRVVLPAPLLAGLRVETPQLFEQLHRNQFSPNVALEVGYVLALGKMVCLLKDSSIGHLHADLLGELYRPFDMESIEDTVTAALASWMKERQQS